MGANQKELRTRIRSVRATLQLTKAMGLVASAHIRRSLAAAENSRAYQEGAAELARLLPENRCAAQSHRPETCQDTKVILIAGDRGMAGGFHQHLFRLLEEREEEAGEIIAIGKKAAERFERFEYPSAEHFSAEDCAGLTEKLCQEYAEGKFCRLVLLFTRYQNMLTQVPVWQEILPVARQSAEKAAVPIWEPDETAVCAAIMKAYLNGMIFGAVKESIASETAARMAAMDAAGRNAQEMLEELRLQYNRVRQGAITQEITEIVAGAGSE